MGENYTSKYDFGIILRTKGMINRPSVALGLTTERVRLILCLSLSGFIETHQKYIWTCRPVRGLSLVLRCAVPVNTRAARSSTPPVKEHEKIT